MDGVNGTIIWCHFVVDRQTDRQAGRRHEAADSRFSLTLLRLEKLQHETDWCERVDVLMAGR